MKAGKWIKAENGRINTADTDVYPDQESAQAKNGPDPIKEGYSCLIIRSMKILNVLVNTFLFYAIWNLSYAVMHGSQGSRHQGAAVCAVYLILLVLLDRIYNAFGVGLLRVSELIYAHDLSAIMTGTAIYGLIMLDNRIIPTPLPFLLLFVVQAGFNSIWAYTVNRIYFSLHQAKRTVIVYRNQNDLKKLDQLKRYTQRFSVEKLVENPRSIRQLIQEVEGYEVIFAVGIGATLRNGLAKYCVEVGVHGYIEPKVGDIILSGAKEMQAFSIPILYVTRAAPPPEYLFVKRMMDIVCSSVLILLTCPVMLVTAAAIKVYDHGPVLYKQVRLTQNGREFEILKFRSMRTDAEKDGVARLSTGEKDDRVTPVGKLIRSCRIDELPQLFNILRGDMAIVGPRPERPEIAREYEKTIPAFQLRLQVKAGLTGYAQIYGKYNTQPYDKLQMDLMYINRMSPAEDIRLMLATVKILFLKESTEGVEERRNMEAEEETREEAV